MCVYVCRCEDVRCVYEIMCVCGNVSQVRGVCDKVRCVCAALYGRCVAGCECMCVRCVMYV